MATSSKPSACPICESGELSEFFVQRDVPAQCGYLAPSRDEAMRCRLGDITLWSCASCGHVWNSSFDPDKMGFDPEYDISLYHSSVYRDYVAGAIERLKSRYGLQGGTALDIACGKGDFLRMLVRAGFERALGFDPTFVESGLSDEEREHITVHRKYYGPDERHLVADLVTCRSALQFITRQREFLRSIRETLDGRFDTIVCFEVPNGAGAFRDKLVWFVMYEVGCFFSGASLARLFRETGFQVLDVLPALDGAHLEIEARPHPRPVAHEAESREEIARIVADTAGFAAEHAAQVGLWTERLNDYWRTGRRVVLWGAGMRAVSLLVAVPAAAGIEFVVDINPKRQGRYMPKTGQQVIEPQRLRDIRPDVVVGTNPIYAREIEAQVRALGLESEFVVLK